MWRSAVKANSCRSGNKGSKIIETIIRKLKTETEAVFVDAPTMFKVPITYGT